MEIGLFNTSFCKQTNELSRLQLIMSETSFSQLQIKSHWALRGLSKGIVALDFPRTLFIPFCVSLSLVQKI